MSEKKKITFDLDRTKYETLRLCAARASVSVGEMIRRAVTNLIEKERPEIFVIGETGAFEKIVFDEKIAQVRRDLESDPKALREAGFVESGWLITLDGREMRYFSKYPMI